jgi:hypothetical protein
VTKPLAFTESSVRRAIAAVHKAGLPIKATSIGPDGTVTIYHDIVAAQPPSGENQGQSKWLDVEA